MSDVRVPSTNLVVIAGRLTRDAELKYIQSGNPVCNFSIANTQYFKPKDGERKEDTTFVDVTCWGKTAEFASKIGKGRPVQVEGRLKSESWEDKATGGKRSKLGIIADRVSPLDWDSNGESSGEHRSERPSQQSSRPSEEPLPEDDIPF